MKDHVKILGVLHIVIGALTVLIAVIMFAILLGAGVVSGDEEALGILLVVGTAFLFLMFIVGIPEIIGGIGLLHYRPWARILAIIIGIIKLLDFPVGTALGVYTLWVLLNEKTVSLFESAHEKEPAA